MKWTIFLLDRSSRRPVRFLAGKAVMYGALAVGAIAAVGWVRVAVMGVRACSAAYTMSKHYADSLQMQERLSFLNGRLQSQRLNLKALSDFEKALRLNYGLKIIPDDVRKAGVGGVPSMQERFAASSGGPLIKKAYQLEAQTAALARQAELEDSLLAESVRHILMQHEQWAQTPSICPTEGRLVSRFGWRTDPMGGDDTRFHRGIDIANAIGTPVYAAADGVVRFTGMQGGFGKLVRIRHNATCYETIYGHLDAFNVESGDEVRRGDLIGFMGNTGRSTGPHLHYEVRDRGRSIDPQKYILPESCIVD
jgi:murein DD-endopeptidase MepM/ murein hydrolase activator NlpD